MRTSRRGLAAAVLSMAVLPVLSPTLSSAAVIYSDGFSTTGDSSNYATFITAGATGPSGDATFAYNYGAVPGSGGLSIPVAPHTTDGSKIGLRLRTDNLQSTVGGSVGASEITTLGLQLPAKYVVSVDVWSNYIGSGTSISASGSNGSTGVNVGIGTTPTVSDTINANNGAMYEAFGDNGGGANADYRVYNDNTHAVPTGTPDYYQAGNGANSATNTDPYYTGAYPSVSAPAAQVTYSATQGGSTAAGTQGFAWHTWTITQDGTNVTWAIDGKAISIVPDTKVTLAGQQISLGNDDSGLTGSSVAANQLLNAEIFDNLTVSTTAAAVWLSSAAILPNAGTVSVTGSNGNYAVTSIASPPAGTTTASFSISDLGTESGKFLALLDLSGSGDLNALATTLQGSLPSGSTVTADPATPGWATQFGGSWSLLISTPNPTGAGANDFLNLDLDSTGFTIARVAAIPEPATASMIAMAAIPLLSRRRKTA